MPYVADTHALVWFFTGSSRLGPSALQVMRQADAGQEVIIIPTIVLGELMSICKSGKASLDFLTTLEKLEAGDNYQIVPLDIATLKIADAIKAELEMHDRFIVATAQRFNALVLTKDRVITQSGTVKTIW